MRRYTCKCGEAMILTSDSCQPCQGCKKCNTNFFKEELQPHTWKIVYNQNTGKPYKRCSKCYTVDEESYKEAKKPNDEVKTSAPTTEKTFEQDGKNKPIPKNLKEAITYLFDENKEFIDKITKHEDDFIAKSHHNVGQQIRNDWGLWNGSELQTWFKEQGIHHADDMSGIILTSFHRKINGKEINLEKQIENCRKYWDKVDPKVNEGKF